MELIGAFFLESIFFIIVIVRLIHILAVLLSQLRRSCDARVHTVIKGCLRVFSEIIVFLIVQSDVFVEFSLFAILTRKRFSCLVLMFYEKLLDF